ncbi:MAG: 50S ribosomal protein L24 [Candidatus Nomurabacteria bacterium]|jgi:large subunit ribosomal protein L24|nr:50S ribosomal protein L24 [Candidatus Nomurabacteria bacterium]
MNRIHKDDVVKITTGNNKGRIGKAVKIIGRQVWVEGVNIKERHIRPNRLNPRGGKKEVHLPVDISNLKLVVDDKESTAKVGFRPTDKGKVRYAKTTGKEIK